MEPDDLFLKLPKGIDTPCAEAWRHFIAAPGRSRELAARIYAARTRTIASAWAGLCFAYHLTRAAEVEDARKTLDEVRDLFATFRDPRGADLAEVLEAYLDIVRGWSEQAVTRLERIAGEHAKSAHAAPLDRFLVHHALGLAYSRLGQLELVLQHHHANVALLERCGTPAALAVVLHNLSGVLGAIDDWPEAYTAAQRTVECCKTMDNAILMRRAQINLALAARFLGRVGEALEILGRLREEPMREPGSDFALFINSAEALAVGGDLEEAKRCLEHARPYASPKDAHQAANCEWVAGLIAAKAGEVPLAILHLENAQHAVFNLKQVHVPILPRIVEQLASCYAQSHDHERAFATYRRFHEIYEARLGYTTRARTFGQQSRRGVLSIESLLRRERVGSAPPVDELGDRARMNEALRRALAGVHKENESLPAGWTARSIARVRTEAHDLGIEEELLGGLIDELRRTSPPSGTENPPAIHVRVLGRFEILVDGAPMRFGRKAPTRPLALVKYLAACGTREPAETEVADALWPDQDGDAALASLAVNLHRLRKLLGRASTVAHHERRLALDAREVGCDAFAFERLLDQSSMTADPEERHGLAAQALDLYRGGFLADEDGDSWILPVRERLRSRFVTACAAQGAFLASVGRMEKARIFYQRGLEADSGVEELGLGVMRCSLALRQPASGIAAYRDLERNLARRGGMKPAAAIVSLYGELLRQSA